MRLGATFEIQGGACVYVFPRGKRGFFHQAPNLLNAAFEIQGGACVYVFQRGQRGFFIQRATCFEMVLNAPAASWAPNCFLAASLALEIGRPQN